MDWKKLSASIFGGNAVSRAPQDANDRQEWLARVHRLEHVVWLLGRMPEGVPPALATSHASPADDEVLVRRVMAAYSSAVATFRPTHGFWDVWHHTIKKPIHEALSGGDFSAAAAVLRDPASNSFFWGFDAIASSPAGEPEPHQLVLQRLSKLMPWQELYGYWLCDGLVSLAQAVGARRATYPEIDIDATLATRRSIVDVDAVLDAIDAELGVSLRFPNPFRGEVGLPSRRGVVGFRAIQSVYQAWRIASFGRGKPNLRVLEIGAGLGRTAYFAHQLGVKDYTIIDVPLTNAAQGYFLGRTLGPNAVQMRGEPGSGTVRIVSNEDLSVLTEPYDLIVNVDSLTEMPAEVARAYWDFARASTSAVLSINHEHNPHTVRELYRGDHAVAVQRYPYPMRRGYVEEWLTW